MLIKRRRKLKLFILQRKRKRLAAIYMFKLSRRLVPNNLQLQFYTTRRKEIKCDAPRLNAPNTHHWTVRHNYFTSIGPSLFNVLPAKLKEAETIDVVKRQLDTFLWTLPDLPTSPGYQVLNRNTILEWMTGKYNYADVIETLAIYVVVRMQCSQR